MISLLRKVVDIKKSIWFEYSIDNGDMRREGIGYKLVLNLFNILTSSSHMQSYLHEPEQ